MLTPKIHTLARQKECQWMASLVSCISRESWGQYSWLSSAVQWDWLKEQQGILGSAQQYYERQETKAKKSCLNTWKTSILLSNTEKGCPNRLWNPDIECSRLRQPGSKYPKLIWSILGRGGIRPPDTASSLDYFRIPMLEDACIWSNCSQ